VSFEEGLKRPDAIWVGTAEETVPSWFVYKDSKIYLLSQLVKGPEEQTVPGLAADTRELVVVTRSKGRETALDRFTASVRVLAGDEWEEAAKLLVDRRRSRTGPPSASIDRWRTTCVIAELAPPGGDG
jgi:hypothetical protein